MMKGLTFEQRFEHIIRAVRQGLLPTPEAQALVVLALTDEGLCFNCEHWDIDLVDGDDDE